ncbi:hypothetical protein SEUCBS139899_002146 [Sporothrix eucalyptigena]|uniref:DUF7136 domain-containing protein n=1 Tax=Sporothrix eucalyptigena TaxID=1812306 RepID=A0ABP0B4H1_9PEZI
MAGLSLRRVLVPLAYLSGLASASFGIGSDVSLNVLQGNGPLSTANGTNDAALLDIEIDVVFPRNESYAQTEILPIAISVRGLGELYNTSEFDLIWDLNLYDPDRINVIDDYLDGALFLPENVLPAGSTNNTDAIVFVGYSNITSWIGKLNYTSHIVLSVGVGYNFTGLCDSRIYSAFVLDESLFQVKSSVELAARPDNATLTVENALADEPDCPQFAMLVSAYPTSTVLTGYYQHSQSEVHTYTTCSSYVGYDTDTTSATPCAATVGPSARSAIGSLASSWATSASESSASASAASLKPTTTSTSTNAAAATPLPLKPALAAVAAVYCIVYY